MGLFDNLGGMLGQVTAAAAPGLISAVLGKTNLGDLNGLVAQLQAGGLNDQVKSWLGSGTNMHVTPEQIRAALSNDQIKQIAAHFGVSTDAALKMLAEHLPATVDQASPGGKLN